MDNTENLNELIRDIEKSKTKNTEAAKIVKEFLMIEIEDKDLAIQIEYLREVFDLNSEKDIVPIPFTPDYINGIINVRGEIVPVLSILKVIGYPEKSKAYEKIAVIDEKFKIALPFNNIIDLKMIDLKDIKMIQDISMDSNHQFVSQEFLYQDRIIRIIDILKLYESDYLI